MTRTSPGGGPAPEHSRWWRDACADLLWGSVCVACQRPGRALCGPCSEGWWRGLVEGGARHERDVAGVTCLSAGLHSSGLRRMVIAHKDEGVRDLGRPLSALLAVLVTEALGRVRAVDPVRVPVPDSVPGPLLLVPAPSRAAAVRARGDDPWLRVVRGAAGQVRRAGVPVVCRPVLATARHVQDQAGLGTSARATNLDGAVRLRSGASRSWEPGTRVLVCDDVVTTGATLRACVEALDAAGATVVGAVTVASVALRHGAGAGGPQGRSSPRTGPDG